MRTRGARWLLGAAVVTTGVAGAVVAGSGEPGGRGADPPAVSPRAPAVRPPGAGPEAHRASGRSATSGRRARSSRARRRRRSSPAFCSARRPVLRERSSRALGLPHRGRLVGGVRLPCQGDSFFTWDPIPRSSPNRSWRRHGTARLVRTVLTTLDGFAAANPHAPRVGVGDLSRPRGGDFGPRFGRLGHVSHQNGLDVDVYYPRRDGRERRASGPRLVDRRLAQDLVDRFVAAGAERVFVGPRVRLDGPPGVVAELARHDDHLHVRLPAR